MGQETKKTMANNGTELSWAQEELQRKIEELEEAKKAAEKAESARDIFLANMSHELRTPINTILGLDELILRESREDAVKEYAKEIRQAGNMLLALISDILDFSKLEAGKMELNEGIYDVSSLLNDLINSISVQQRKKKLDLVLKIADDLPHMLFGDEVHIRQVMGNLLSNAVRFTEKGRITLQISWKKVSKDSVELYVIVKDTGIGIKEENIPKLFMAFQRMDFTMRGKSEGTGLSLAITDRLIGMMGGTLKAQSVYGRGSAFSFRIVQKVMDWEPLGDFEKKYHESLSSIGDYHEKFIAPTGRILVVDDNAMNRAVAQGLLKPTRLQVDVAASGEECLELLKRKTYHLICMDHMMPVMDGVQTLHAIRELEGNPSQNIPVIALTANAVAGAREFYIKEGFQDYLTKPIEADKFEDVLIEYLPENVVYLTKDRDAKEGQENKGEETEFEIWESRFSLMGVNLRKGLRYMGGDETLYGKVLHDFYSILQEKETALQDFLGKGDMPGYAIIVHSLKGNARNVGADDLADEAFELEKMSKAGQLEDVTVRSPILFSMMKNMRNSLGVFLKSVETDKKKEGEKAQDVIEQITDEEWARALDELAARLDDFDDEGSVSKLQEMKRYERPEGDKKMLRLCEKAIKDYAFDIALEVVNAVRCRT